MLKQQSCSEAMLALQFYTTIVQALRSTGIRKVLVTMTPDGELEADVVIEKSPPARGEGQGCKRDG